MRKRHKYQLVIFISIILFYILLVSFLDPKVILEYEALNKIPIQEGKDSEMKSETTFEEVIDNYPNILELHWGQMPLTYKIINEEKCPKYDVDRFENALKFIKDKTGKVVNFRKIVANNSDLNFICVKSTETICEETYDPYYETLEQLYPTLVNKTYKGSGKWEVCYIDTSTLGESQIYSIENKILNSTLFIYYNDYQKEGCYNFPSKEIHEIFHSLGFGHNVDYAEADLLVRYSSYGDVEKEVKDIMFPYSICAQQIEIQQEYIRCLKYIYSNGEIKGDCSNISFQGDLCENGWYPVDGTEYCCPEPNMIIEGNYCEYK